MAAKAACGMLLRGIEVTECSILTPKGLEVSVPILHRTRHTDFVSCAVTKDAGDDCDATDGMEIYAHVRRCPEGIHIDGGEGVGRVTRPGLDQPVGAAAINRVPRRMIAAAVSEVCTKYGSTRGE